jgi:hypothetical protein
MRWLVDTAAILRTYRDALDWQRLAVNAARQHMILPLQQTLGYLREQFGIEVPTEARRLVDALHPSWPDRFEHRIGMRRPWGKHPFWQTLPNEWFHYRRARRVAGNLKFAYYLRLVNNLDESVYRHAFKLTRVAAAETWGRLKRRSGLGRRSLSFDNIPEEAMAGFYPPELFQQKLFRWSMPIASITIPLQDAPQQITLQLAPFRDWDEVRQGIRVRMNRQWIPPEEYTFGDWSVSFPVHPDMFVDGEGQRLELQCPEWEAAEQDPRRLGLPVVGLDYSLRAA